MSDQGEVTGAPSELVGVDQQTVFYGEGATLVHPLSGLVYKRINGNWVLQETK